MGTIIVIHDSHPWASDHAAFLAKLEGKTPVEGEEDEAMPYSACFAYDKDGCKALTTPEPCARCSFRKSREQLAWERCLARFRLRRLGLLESAQKKYEANGGIA